MSTTAMNNAVLALNAQSQSLATISQNVANVSTTGYKSSDTLFSTVLSKSSANLDIFGVQATNRTNVESQGTISATSNWSDLAINGDGMFIVNTEMDGSGTTLFTRDGSFEISAVDSDGDGLEDTGYLVDGNGYYLQGWEAATDGSINTASNTLSSVHYTAATTTPGNTTTTATLYGAVDAAATPQQEMAVGVYGPELGSDGTSTISTTSLEMQWTPTSHSAEGNTWDLTFGVVGGTVANATTSVTFDGNGAMTSDGLATLDITWSDGTTSQMAVDYSNIMQLAGTTVIDFNQQDGYGAGNLSSVTFDSTGQMSTNYDNGYAVTGYQVALADFVSENSLEERSGNVYAQTPESGDYELLAAGSQASFVAGALEASTVDLAEQFTRMVMTQTAYDSASKVFTVADEMVQTIYNL